MLSAEAEFVLRIVEERGIRLISAVRHLQRVYMANRGIWDFGWWCGPVVSVQATEADIDLSLGVFAGFIDELLT